jgi:hypothetical protein
MPTDFAYALMLIPVLAGIAALIVVAIFSPKVPVGVGFVGLGRRRIALGYLGALAATLAYSFINAVQLMLWKADQGHISASEAQGRFFSTTLYLFVLYAPFVIGFLSIIGLPFLQVMRRLRVATVAGAVSLAIVLVAAITCFTLAFPYNLWCGSHAWQCGKETFESAFAFAIPVALAFAIAAGLPWLRNAPGMPNNVA